MMLLFLLAAFVMNGPGQVALHPALTPHVPEAVTSGAAVRIGAPSPSQPMELSIALPLRNEDELRALIAAIYDPASPEFRHYLSVAQFSARYSATPQEYETLVRWAVASGLQPRELAANRHVLDVQTTVAGAERALHLRIGLYRHPAEARAFFAPDREPSFDLPLPVLHVSGLDNEALPVSHLVRGNAEVHALTGSGPGGQFIGSDVRAAYYGGTAYDGRGQALGLFEFYGYNIADVKAYFAAVGQTNKVPISGISLNGARLQCTGNCDDSEQVLDIEEAISMAPGLKRLYVYVGNSDVSIINQMASDDTSNQLSCSWGFSVDQSSLDPLFEEMASQGQSFLDATGDDGYKLKEGVVWPGDDAYVTAVGGTDLTTNGAGGAWASETGWSGSGGGPSPDGIKIPSYQLPFVTSTNKASKTLRNVPDVAGDADTDNYVCYDGGCSGGNGGTSFAAPLLAGYIALVNQYAIAQKEAPVGFLNPALYTLGASKTYAKDFHDETSGNNGKYSAGCGFDLVTGFGSPFGNTLLKALVEQPRSTSVETPSATC